MRIGPPETPLLAFAAVGVRLERLKSQRHHLDGLDILGHFPARERLSLIRLNLVQRTIIARLQRVGGG
jgi:hypothetical protein